MKKNTLFCIAALIFTAAFSQTFTVSYVNGYKILQGERPSINVRDFSEDAYEQGKINIKIVREYEQRLPNVNYQAQSGGFVRSGITELDALNEQFNATAYTPLFSILHQTNVNGIDFRERHRAWGFHLWFTILLDDNVSVADAVEAYQALSFVEVAEPIYKTVLYGADKITEWSPNDPRITDQWHYNNTGQVNGTPGCDISLFGAWEIEKGNSNVIVSVVDCGIQATHPDLQANMWEQIGYNFYQNTATINPGDHGCHTGGTISAVTNNGVGVAGIAGGSGSGNGVRLMTCQVYNPAGNAGSGFENAYRYAADNGACISQNSWGYVSPNSVQQSVLTAIDYFIANGGGDVMEDGIVIFASGNNNNWPYNGLEGNYYPGCYPPVLGVTATNNQDKKSSYAHYGTWVGLSAPGGETGSVTARGVLSCTRTGYAYYQGTSMACPHVSGAAALLVSYAARLGYKLSSAEIKELLKSTADDHYDLNPAYVGKLGTGRLNAHNALLALIDYLVFVDNPENVVAATVSDSEIELNWQKNEDNDKVMVITNTVNEFGIPQKETEYQVGDSLLNGGVVLYIGDTENCLHSELSSFTTYYYKLFSFTEDFDYSRGVECEATTLCKMMEIQWEGFEDGNVLCLEQENIVGDLLWTIGQGNGGSFPDHAYEGNYNLYIASDSPDDIGSITRLFLPTLDMDGFNNAQLSFAFHNQANTDLTDHLTIYYKVADSTTWNIWKVYDENQDFWTLDTLTLPVNVATETLQICLEGKINGGHGICLDNLSIQGFINVGINTYNIDNQITVYPNPTTGELRIKNYELRIDGIEIFDVYGRSVLSHTSHLTPHTSINIFHLPSGIYFIKIETNKGTVTKKVIKE